MGGLDSQGTRLCPSHYYSVISGRSQYNKIDPVLTGQAARQDSPRYKTTARCFGWLEQNPAYWRDDASCQSDGVMKLFISRTSIITIEMEVAGGVSLTSL